MSFEPAGFAREINRAPRQGKQPGFAFTRFCLMPESSRVEREREIERMYVSRVMVGLAAGQRARGGYPRRWWPLQQCGSMHRDSNWLPDSNSFSRPLRHGRLSRPRAFGWIEKKRKRAKARRESEGGREVLALFGHFTLRVTRHGYRAAQVGKRIPLCVTFADRDQVAKFCRVA